MEQHIAVGSQLRGHSDPETAAKLVIHTAVAYSQLRGLNEFAFDTDATSTCAVSGVCMGKLVSGGAYNSDTPERLGWLASHSWSLEGLVESCQFARWQKWFSEYSAAEIDVNARERAPDPLNRV